MARCIHFDVLGNRLECTKCRLQGKAKEAHGGRTFCGNLSTPGCHHVGLLPSSTSQNMLNLLPLLPLLCACLISASTLAASSGLRLLCGNLQSLFVNKSILRVATQGSASSRKATAGSSFHRHSRSFPALLPPASTAQASAWAGWRPCGVFTSLERWGTSLQSRRELHRG